MVPVVIWPQSRLDADGYQLLTDWPLLSCLLRVVCTTAAVADHRDRRHFGCFRTDSDMVVT